MRSSLVAGSLLLLLSLLDGVLTAANIQRWGIECEFNPLMRDLIQTHGMWVMFAIKGFFGGGLLYLLSKTDESKLRRFITPSLFAIVGVYMMIVFYGYLLWTVH